MRQQPKPSGASYEYTRAAIHDLVTVHFPTFAQHVNQTTPEALRGDAFLTEGREFLEMVLRFAQGNLREHETKTMSPLMQEYELYFAGMCFDLAEEYYKLYDEPERAKTAAHLRSYVDDLMDQPWNAIAGRREHLDDLRSTPAELRSPELEADAHFALARSYFNSLHKEMPAKVTHAIRSAAMQHLVRSVELYGEELQGVTYELKRTEPKDVDRYFLLLKKRAQSRGHLASVAVQLDMIPYATTVAQAAIDDYENIQRSLHTDEFAEEIRKLRRLLR